MLSHYTGNGPASWTSTSSSAKCRPPRLRPRYTIYDALERTDSDDAIYTATSRTTSSPMRGLPPSSPPRRSSEATASTRRRQAHHRGSGRSRFDYVVIDTPAGADRSGAGRVSDVSDVLYTMATLDLPSVRNMGVFLGTSNG